MPQHNPLIAPSYVTDQSGSVKAVNLPGDLAVGVGPVHLTVIGLVLAAVAGLILLRKVGFRFSVVAGGR